MKNLFPVLVVLAVLGLGGYGFYAATHKAPVEEPQESGVAAGEGTSGLCWSINGLNTCAAKVSLRKATTTPCAIKSPSATSTLTYAAVRLDTSSSTATIWDIAKATTAFATTTPLIPTAYNVVAGAQAFVLASTSPAAAAATVFAPNTYLVFGARQGITAGDTAGTGFVPVGNCSAKFEVSS